ncbi:hypothetical protein MP228_000991 [Amoeboaphelidium protococcarum]|nr:hypothetical protein MP228_000991 [Amoeboaphelidium protococcarum]
MSELHVSTARQVRSPSVVYLPSDEEDSDQEFIQELQQMSDDIKRRQSQSAANIPNMNYPSSFNNNSNNKRQSNTSLKFQASKQVSLQIQTNGGKLINDSHNHQTEKQLIADDEKMIIENYSPMEYFDGKQKVQSAVISSHNSSFKMEHLESESEDPFVYRQYFSGREHKNLMGFHPDLGSICVSLRKEVDNKMRDLTQSPGSKNQSYIYRGIFRSATRFAYVCRSDVEIQGMIRDNKRASFTAKLSTKEVLCCLFPQCESAKLKEIDDPKLPFELLNMEEKLIQINFKFGVLYVKQGQEASEDEIFANTQTSDLYQKFLQSIGEKVKLKGFKGYRGGLDTTKDTTGLDSVVAKHKNMNVMFHVSDMLPLSQTNKQQLERKAHIGNDIGILVFKENSATPFSTSCIVSQFPHFFIVIEPAENPNPDGQPLFRVSCARKSDVPEFGPYPMEQSFFEMNKTLKDFVLGKLINGENAAQQSVKFTQLRNRTRKSILDDLTKTYLKKTNSNSSLAQWKSQIFGTTDNLSRSRDQTASNLALDKSSDKRRSAFMLTTLSRNPTSSSSTADPQYAQQQQRSLDSKSGMYDKQKSMSISGIHHQQQQQQQPQQFSYPQQYQQQSGSGKTGNNRDHRSSSPVSPMSDQLTPFSPLTSIAPTNLDGYTVSAPLSSRQSVSVATQPEVQQMRERVLQLEEENRILKSKLLTKFGTDIPHMQLELKELDMKLELKNAQVKLKKALAFIEALMHESDEMIQNLNAL